MAVDLSVFKDIKTVADYNRANQEFELKRQLLGNKNPAAVQIANELQSARANGDVQRVNDLLLAAKSLDKGLVMGADGTITQMENYAPAIAGIEGAKSGAKEQAQKNVDLVMNPQITRGETDQKNQSNLGYAPQIKGAEKLADLTAEAQGTAIKTAAQAPVALSVIADARKILPKATSGGADTVMSNANRYFGNSTVKTQSDAKLKSLSAKLTQNVPRMEGPQSDRDVNMYREAAANIGDSEVPYPDRLAALDTVESLYDKYKSLQNTTGAPTINPETGATETPGALPVVPPYADPEAAMNSQPPTTKVNPANIPMDKVKLLWANPDKAADFDAKYGAGAAKAAMGMKR